MYADFVVWWRAQTGIPDTVVPDTSDLLISSYGIASESITPRNQFVLGAKTAELAINNYATHLSIINAPSGITTLQDLKLESEFDIAGVMTSTSNGASATGLAIGTYITNQSMGSLAKTTYGMEYARLVAPANYGGCA
jgi:hypothetical protein